MGLHKVDSGHRLFPPPRFEWAVALFLCAAIGPVTPTFALPTSPTPVRPRAALIIGNAHYDSVGSLQNPVNDARDMCGALEGLGFKTSCHFDIKTRVQLRAVIQDYAESLPAGAVSFVYYAGHAVQINGQNYLIPTAAAIKSESTLVSEAVSISYLMHQLQDNANYLNVVILDACRNNPLASRGASAMQGLAQVVEVPDGTMVLYATAADETALDGQGRNGIMTKNILANIHEPGTIDDLFKQVSLGVQKDTQILGRAQKPAMYTNFAGQYCLVKCTDLELMLAQKKQLDEKVQDLQSRAAAGDSAARAELETARRENARLAAEVKKKSDEARQEEKRRRSEFVPPAF